METRSKHRYAPDAVSVAFHKEYGMWPVRGGGPGDDEGDLTAEERKDLKDMRAWRRRQHAEDDRLKAAAARLESDTATTTAEKRELAALRAQVAEGAGSRSAAAAPEAYPDPVDDPAGYAARAQQENRALRDELRTMRTEMNGLRGKVDEGGRNMAAQINGSGNFHRVVSRNDQLFEDFATEHSLSASETEDLKEYVQAFRINNRGFGEYAQGAVSPDGRQVWSYTKEALAAAANAAFPEKTRESIRLEERASLEKELGPRALPKLEFGKGAVPANDAPIEQLTEFYYSLPGNSPQAQEFIDGLSLEQTKAVLEHNVNNEAEMLGYGPEADSVSPIGVQDHVVEVM
jgi:hypothetical protein